MSGKPVSRPCDEMLEGPDHFRFADNTLRIGIITDKWARPSRC
jgi:hypothetical protein